MRFRALSECTSLSQHLPDSMRSPSRQLALLLDRLAPLEGYNLTALAGVRLRRSNRPFDAHSGSL